ncbi:MAG: sulfotransferase domain-containing protein [Pseudomonadales bacterium]|nr:sulfotransferase domain-containing protein [Pseudomonadales bacterium]MDG1442221.1 sulfotransferase domain-containing protein [Pseudomonadales bacterium]
MRIIVASPPKSGNEWVKNLLAVIYGLDLVAGPKHEDDMPEMLSKEVFLDNSIFHEHYSPSIAFKRIARELDAKIVTTIRNPYDIFVSLYFYVQNFPQLFPRGHSSSLLFGRAIDHPRVIQYLADVEHGFGALINLSCDWYVDPDNFVLKYEDLYESPLRELRTLTENLGAIPDMEIERAIEVCSASNMRKRGVDMQKHVRSASTGDWKNHLTKNHTGVIAELYSDKIRMMGYEVA